MRRYARRGRSAYDHEKAIRFVPFVEEDLSGRNLGRTSDLEERSQVLRVEDGKETTAFAHLTDQAFFRCDRHAYRYKRTSELFGEEIVGGLSGLSTVSWARVTATMGPSGCRTMRDRGKRRRRMRRGPKSWTEAYGPTERDGFDARIF
jgi:hypothetical protein